MSKKRPGNRFLYQIIARKIISRIARENLMVLPSLSDLAAAYHVSLNTIVRAIKFLQTTKVISGQSGGKMIVLLKSHSGKKPPPSLNETPQSRTSADILYEKIRDNIQIGVYRVGSELPKSNFFILEERVSSVTVSLVFKMLAKAGLIHKRIKSWIVGPSEIIMPRPELGPSSQSTVLIFVPDIHQWHTSLEFTGISSFVQEFIQTIESRHGIKTCVVFKEGQGAGPDKFHSGKHEIFNEVRVLGDRYLGTLIFSHIVDLPDVSDWIEWFAGFKRPVVWFDNGNMGRHLSRKKIPRKNYYRCYPGVSNLGALAVQALVNRHHQTIALPQCILHKDSAWFIDRMAQIRNAAENSPKPVKILLFRQDEQMWLKWGMLGEGNQEFIATFQSIIQSCANQHPELSAAALEEESGKLLRKEFPSLAAIADNPKITAIIAPNQWCAMVYYYWFRFAGFEIPKRISILGFDNITSFVLYPVSTFDPGYDNLGYQAAHIILGDIPIKADRWGNVTTTPQLIDRGSIGPPGTMPQKTI